MTIPTSQLAATASALAGFGCSHVAIDALTDSQLLEAQAAYATHHRAVQAYGVWIAGAIARRSAFSLGYSGLARRNGFGTPEGLIHAATGGTKAEAVKFVQLGSMMSQAQGATDAHDDEVTPEQRWQIPIVTAVGDGTLSVDAADAIRRGLGQLDAAVTAIALREAADRLVAEAAVASADEIFRRARQARDALDADGIALRQKERRDLRYFSAKRRPDGLVGGSYLLADEDAALMLAIYDRSTEPSIDDNRTAGQRAADDFVGLLRIGADADDGTVFGTRTPAVRVAVQQAVRESRAGSGFLQDADDPVSLETIDRLECDGGTVGVLFDNDGQVVNVGREQRLFTTRQRIGFAVRDGGCRFPGCQRPVSWCEAHHINQWLRDGGKTNIEDGILLCRMHHMLVHDNHWEILRRGASYWLQPPPDIDPAQTLRPMPSRSRVIRELAGAPPGAAPPGAAPPGAPAPQAGRQ
jgi:hypothetical protein